MHYPMVGLYLLSELSSYALPYLLSELSYALPMVGLYLLSELSSYALPNGVPVV